MRQLQKAQRGEHMISIHINEEVKDIDDLIWTLEKMIERIQDGYTSWYCPEYKIKGNEETKNDDQTALEYLIEENGDSTGHSIEIEYRENWSVYENGLELKDAVQDAIEVFEGRQGNSIESINIEYIKINDLIVPKADVVKWIKG
mgnify:FL=1